MSLGLDQINIPPPGLSLGADIYRNYRTGAITWDEYLTANAAMVADLSHEERVRIYPPMPPVVKHYADSRIGGGRGYDPGQSVALGRWRYDVFQALDHNNYIEQHFQWALEKVQAVKLLTQVEKLKSSVRRFENLRFPHADYKLALDVLKMDSDEKQRKGRGV